MADRVKRKNIKSKQSTADRVKRKRNKLRLRGLKEKEIKSKANFNPLGRYNYSENIRYDAPLEPGIERRLVSEAELFYKKDAFILTPFSMFNKNKTLGLNCVSHLHLSQLLKLSSIISNDFS